MNMKDSYIVGIQWGYNSTACLLKNGEVVACASEERFTRKKNEVDFPIHALNWIMSAFSLKPSMISGAAIASLEGDLEYTLTRRYCDYSIQDHVREQHEYWYPKIYDGRDVSYLEVFSDKIRNDLFPRPYWEEQARNPQPEKYWKDRETIAAEFLKIPVHQVRRMEHHRCHAAYGYYGSPFRGNPCLIFTIDAYGDGANATISSASEDGLVRLYETDQFYVGRMYRFMTLLLGMKPDEHEYKVMGLAPYAKSEYYQSTLDVFKRTQIVEGIDFQFLSKPRDFYFHFRKEFEGHRFDCIAGALQEFVEETLIKWVGNTIRRFGIHRIVFSGGVSMNIKAMGKIANLPEVEEFYVCGSGSDESLAIGAAYSLGENMSKEDGTRPESVLKPIQNLYLGPEPKIEEYDLVESLDRNLFEIRRGVLARDIAGMLEQGCIIARCAGRMEFGARALGNRSILANPSLVEVVPTINEQIKNRDFWMPFAPVIIEEDWGILINPKNIYSPFMTVGFDTKSAFRKKIRAALHPADFSARPQMLKRDDNPPLWEIIHEYKKRTGIGCLLNTSFNLHGYPIVNSIADAFHVFSNSGLSHLLISDILISKKL